MRRPGKDPAGTDVLPLEWPMRPCCLVLGALVSATGCLGHKATSPPRASAPVATAAPVPTTAPVATADGFTAAVRPMLAQSCAPCHNPGGKMYERLPFDDPKVVREHEKGVRRRLKGENLEVFERWLTTPGEK